MTPHVLITPFASWAAATLALTVTAAMVVRIKQDIAAGRIRTDILSGSINSTAENLAAEMANLKETIETMRLPSIADNNAQCLTLTKRARALRMQRRGDSCATIAAAVGAPHREVELLLKISTLLESK